MKTKRTQEETLHMALDILVAQFIRETGKLLSKTTIMSLIMWSGKRVVEQENAKHKRKPK